MKPTTIFIADDQPLFRHGLVSILRMYPEFRAVGDCSTIDEALFKVQKLRPDIIIMGESTGGGDAIKATSWIKNNCPSTKIIVRTESENTDKIRHIIDAGANDYLIKGKLSIANIVASIRVLSHQEAPIPSSLISG